MVYDNSKDKLIKCFDLESDNNTQLSFSIYSYNNGKHKLQIQRIKDDKFLKLGRMTLDEVEFLKEIIDEIIENMKTE